MSVDRCGKQRNPRGWKIRERPDYEYGRPCGFVLRAELNELVESMLLSNPKLTRTEIFNKSIEEYFVARNLLKCKQD